MCVKGMCFLGGSPHTCVKRGSLGSPIPVIRGRGLPIPVIRGRGLPIPVIRGRGSPIPVIRGGYDVCIVCDVTVCYVGLD